VNGEPPVEVVEDRPDLAAGEEQVDVLRTVDAVGRDDVADTDTERA
jgi:hypothetical protein